MMTGLLFYCMGKRNTIRYFSGAPEDKSTVEPKVRQQKPRDFQGRYISANNNKPSWTMNFFKALRSLFDNHFLVTSIKFILNYILNKFIGTTLEKDLGTSFSKSPGNTRKQGFLTFVSRFLNWSIGITIIVTLFRYLYDSIIDFINHYIPLGKAAGTPVGVVDRLAASLKALWPGSTDSQPSFWDKIKDLFHYIISPWTATPPVIPPTPIWWPTSVWSQIILFAVGPYLLYIFIVATIQTVLILLQRIVDWVTPATIAKLKDRVERHSRQAHREITNLTNFVILIEKNLQVLQNNNKLSLENIQSLQKIVTEARDVREVEKKLANFIIRIDASLSNMGQKSDHVSYLIATTMREFEARRHQQLLPMGKSVIDDEGFAKSFRMMKEERASGFAMSFFNSVKNKFVDPEAGKITKEMTQIAEILEKENERSRASSETSSQSGAESPRDPGLGNLGTSFDHQWVGGTTPRGTNFFGERDIRLNNSTNKGNSGNPDDPSKRNPSDDSSSSKPSDPSGGM